MNRLNNIYNKIAITKALIQYIFNRRILHVRFMDDKTFNFIFTNTIIVLLPPPAPSHFLFNHRTRTNFNQFYLRVEWKIEFRAPIPRHPND